MKRLSLILAAAAMYFGTRASAQAGGQSVQKADVPVKSVMLFSSGVGFFEHAGSVRGDGSTELRFKTAQINDILKSLVLQDEDGGKVSAITYPSQDPVEKTLRSFQVDITSNPSLSSLLNQLRGARVTILSGGERISGSVMGVEVRTEISTSDKAKEIPVLNLLSGATIRAVELPSISSLSLDDPKLQDELAKALSALSQSRDRDKKPVTINFTGTGDRRVRVGYVVETPIWKTSYRLLLDEKVSRLQGWAIVENQTESDWNNIALSLVSGRPMSFTMDLYQPLYLERPVVTQELFAGLRPRVFDGGVADSTNAVPMMLRAAAESDDFSGRGARGGIAGGPVPALMAKVAGANVVPGTSQAQRMMRDEVSPAANARVNYGASVQSNVSGNKMGELFQYAVGNVTLARQKSAMLPIIADTVSVERMSIYNASTLESNPLNGVRIRNTTGKHWLEGPVTVLDGNRYAGDAQVNNVPPGQDRLLTYGIDLDMVMDQSKVTHSAAVVSGRIYKGVLTVERKFVETREYRAENKSDKDKVLLIEHPSRARAGYKLVETQKPVETTEAHYRFEGKAPARKVTVLSVKEESVQSQSLSILPLDLNTLLLYSRTGEIPSNVRDALSKAMALKQSLVDSEREIADYSKRITEITTEQSRMRENMKTVAQNTDYYKRLLEKLNTQESQLEKLQSDRDALQTKRDRQRAELESYLGSLTIG